MSRAFCLVVWELPKVGSEYRTAIGETFEGENHLLDLVGAVWKDKEGYSETQWSAPRVISRFYNEGYITAGMVIDAHGHRHWTLHKFNV